MSKINVVSDNSFTLIRIVTYQSFIRADGMIRRN